MANGHIPEALKLQVRSLYVLHGYAPIQIAQMLQLTADQIYRLVSRNGWNRLKEERGRRKEAAQDARAQADVAKVQEVVAIRAEELTVRSLDLCSDFLDTKDAKNLSMASTAARNLSEITRKSRGLDQVAAVQVNAQNVQLNTFLARGERVMHNVTPTAISDPRDVI